MAVVKTVEVQAGNGNGNGCGEHMVDQGGEVFCNFGAALTGIVVEIGAKALTGVDRAIKAPISPEQALAFAKTVVAKDIIETFLDGVRHRQGPLTDDLLAVTATAQQKILNKLYNYYEETGEQTMTSLAQALREQFAKSK